MDCKRSLIDAIYDGTLGSLGDTYSLNKADACALKKCCPSVVADLAIRQHDADEEAGYFGDPAAMHSSEGAW